jgi:glycosyltransferase involved in cell wall biosynthesis
MNNSNNNSPLITVGITTFERPTTLKQTIQSVLNQTYKNLEIFVCDDHSIKNDTSLIVNSFQDLDKRIIFFKRDHNYGVTENVNLMVKNASGKYFLWLCDDDWIDPSYIESCLDFMHSNKEYSLVTGGSKFYLENELLYEAEKISIEDDSAQERFIAFHNQFLGTANSPNFGLINKEHLLHTPLRNILGHDNVLVGNISIFGKIKTLNNVYVHRRLGGMSETLSKMSKVCNYSFLEKYFSFLALYINIIFDMMSFSSKYKNLTTVDKISLSLRFNYELISNFNTYISRYLKYRNPLNFMYFQKSREAFIPKSTPVES